MAKPKRKKKDPGASPFAIKEGGFRFGRLAFSRRVRWTEDSFVTEAQGKEVLGRSFNLAILPAIASIAVLLIFILMARTAWLQIIKGDYYYQIAEGNRIRIERIEAKRGVIYDRNINPLVRNTANFLIYFIPADLPDSQSEVAEIISQVSNILEKDYSEDIRSKLASIKQGSLESYQPLFIEDNIEYNKAMQLYLKTDQWPGVILSNKTKREYNLSCLSLSHIMGYTGKVSESELEQLSEEYLPIDYIGKMGIEFFWENELRGKNGKKQIEVDAWGKEKKILGQQEGEDGHNLVLSLDTSIQKKLEEILIEQLARLKLGRAAAIILNPQNGEILSLVSLPAYNNNLFARGITESEYELLINQPDKPLYNRAISGEYPSGSTIKPVWAAAALQENIITEHTTFLSVGGISIGQWFFPDWRAGGHGRTDVRRAIAESINTFFYYTGGGYEDFRGLGVERMLEYGELFGLNAQLGIDLAGEAKGFLPSKEWKEKTKGESWYIGDTYHLAIGQGDLLVTPLQVAVYTGVFANGGKLYRPHFVTHVLSSQDVPIQSIENLPIREDFIDPYNIKVVREGMRQTVTGGSARSLQVVPVSVAGKTGTAQWSTKHPTHAWFTGFAPFKDPELVVTVLIEEGGEGSDTAVPVVREFLQWYFGEYKNNIDEPDKIE
jgi:penicillin-binding protein 2